MIDGNNMKNYNSNFDISTNFIFNSTGTVMANQSMSSNKAKRAVSSQSMQNSKLGNELERSKMQILWESKHGH